MYTTYDSMAIQLGILNYRHGYGNNDEPLGMTGVIVKSRLVYDNDTIYGIRLDNGISVMFSGTCNAGNCFEPINKQNTKVKLPEDLFSI